MYFRISQQKPPKLKSKQKFKKKKRLKNKNGKEKRQKRISKEIKDINRSCGEEIANRRQC